MPPAECQAPAAAEKDDYCEGDDGQAYHKERDSDAGSENRDRQDRADEAKPDAENA